MANKFLELFDGTLLDSYLGQCRARNSLVETTDTHVPPTPEEVKELIAYLKAHRLKPAIVGSVGILHHLGPDIDPSRDFRPTGDLDIWVSKVPEPPTGWIQDPEAVGVASWISPSGGYVDFLEAGHEFPSGEKAPANMDYDEPSTKGPYPIAGALTLLKMKLSSYREKDIADAMAMVRKLGKIPDLGKLNPTQRDNFGLVKQWFQLRPKGKYGE